MKAIPFLTLIPAGAGSGKTHRIKEQLADWVETGRVQPHRIAAVTFTEAAASEMRERIRTTLMARGRLEDALCLDQAFISTIHGFGRRLLTEYAFEAGHCPATRLLGEDEEQLLLRKAIARIDRIEPLSRDLHRFGYSYDFNSGMTDVEQFRHRILDTIHMLRIIGGDRDRKDRLAHCLDRIEQIYGPTSDAVQLSKNLRNSVRTLLKRYPDCMVDFVNSKSAKSSVEDDFRALQGAAGTDALERDWKLWKRLQGLKVFKKDDQLPAVYQELARDVMAHACMLARHPGPLRDARTHAQILLESAWDALSDYAQSKKQKGIIDYTDMIDGACQLLDQPDVIDHLSDRFDCLVIDEFQDTNPLQFAFLWKLHRAGVPALIVGDTKQSIMGFQSADPRLMESLLGQAKKHCTPLDCNWRSQAKLMEVINTVGDQLFGKRYTELTPQVTFKSRLSALETISFQGPGITNAVKAQHVAARIEEILSDKKTKVFDRHLNKHRPIRGADIAILGLTHGRLATYAEALREIGIRARLAQDGWFESRPVQLAYYGLSFVSDPQDRHAALYLAVTELGQEDLNSAIQTLLDGNELIFPLLQRLKMMEQSGLDFAVDEMVARTIDAMGLFDLVATWPDAAQHRANLLRLIDEARNFVTADREALASGGFHGSGLKTFLAWLGSQLEGRDSDRQPDAQVHDEDAVELQTWHAAKGREWPVVVVTTLDRTVGGQLPSLDVQYTEFKALDRIIENARIEYSPSFAATETNTAFIAPLDQKACSEGLNLLYVALTRAREQLILEWPEHLEKSSKYTYWHLFKDSAKARLQGNRLHIGPSSFSCRVSAADREPPEQVNTLSEPSIEELPQTGRRALEAGIVPESLTPCFIAPSQMQGQPADGRLIEPETIIYGSRLSLTLPSGAHSGSLIHRAIELLGQGVSPAKAQAIMAAHITDADWDQIQQMVTAFLEYLNDYFEATALHWEVPITARNQGGSVISGTIDLIIETPDGWWVVDHKSDLPEDLEKTFQHYYPQIDCYARALAGSMGQSIVGVAVHWACLGAISRATWDNRKGDQ